MYFYKLYEFDHECPVRVTLMHKGLFFKHDFERLVSSTLGEIKDKMKEMYDLIDSEGFDSEFEVYSKEKQDEIWKYIENDNPVPLLVEKLRAFKFEQPNEVCIFDMETSKVMHLLD